MGLVLSLLSIASSFSFIVRGLGASELGFCKVPAVCVPHFLPGGSSQTTGLSKILLSEFRKLSDSTHGN